MFCPLCKAEYREGFTTCSDCHLALVVEAEARAAKTRVLLSTTSQNAAEDLAGTLAEAGIPFRLRSEIRGAQLSSGIFFAKKPVVTFSYRITILQEDWERARAIHPHAEASEPKPASERPDSPDLFTKRKLLLRIGAALCFAGILLFRWTDPDEMTRLGDGSGFETVYRACYLLLVVAGCLAGISSVLLLTLAWAGRLDKLGRLSLLFLFWSLLVLGQSLAFILQ